MSVLNTQHVNDVATDYNDTELYLFLYHNSENWVQCVRCFHWNHEGYALGTSFVYSTCR